MAGIPIYYWLWKTWSFGTESNRHRLRTKEAFSPLELPKHIDWCLAEGTILRLAIIGRVLCR